MDKDSLLQLQKIDCNCSECIFMVRDNEKFNKSLEFHKIMQLEEFEREKKRWKLIVEGFKQQGELEKEHGAQQVLNKMKFQFDKKDVLINYGDCSKFNKPVSFIPNTCQPQTQHCFVHRRN